MGKARWLVLGASVALFASAAACGGDEAAIGPGGAEAGADGTTPGTDDAGASTTDGGGGTDSSTTDGSGGEGGPSTGSNPGKISCGTAECTSGAQTCCEPLGGGGSSDACPYCRDAGGGAGQCQGLTAACDEKADCADAGLCCLGGGGAGIACRPACNQGRIQICKTNAECVVGDAGCQPYTCPGNRVIHSCTKPTGCN